VILTIDLGTSVTKAALWDQSGMVATGHATLTTAHHGGGKVEQDASTWWRSVEEACRAAGARTGTGVVDAVDAVVFAAARQTFVPVTASGRPVGPALLWSDRRAHTEAAGLVETCGGSDNVRSRTGAVLDGAAVAAKVAWLADHEPNRLIAASWILSPRDLMVWELTGVVATDVSLASATGLYDTEGREVPELVGQAAGKLPEVVAPDTVVGRVRPAQGRGLGVKAGIPVVIGAGDRACEVLGTGASAERPMVAWGTTANVSVPVPSRPHPVPDALTVTRGALGGWLIEGGLSAAGSLLAWVGGLTGTSIEELARKARMCPPGARGVLALPWPGGARAPWWCDDAGAGFVGLGFEHGPADLARSVLEAVAFEVARCLDAVRGTGADPRALAIGGSAATGPAWTEVLTGVTGLPAQRRRSGEAAMAGAALLASAALRADVNLEQLDPVAMETTPPGEVVERYAQLRGKADRLATAILDVTAAAQESVISRSRP
jgi:xylulokinase